MTVQIAMVQLEKSEGNAHGAGIPLPTLLLLLQRYQRTVQRCRQLDQVFVNQVNFALRVIRASGPVG